MLVMMVGFKCFSDAQGTYRYLHLQVKVLHRVVHLEQVAQLLTLLTLLHMTAFGSAFS